MAPELDSLSLMGNNSFTHSQQPEEEKQSRCPSVHTNTNTHPRIDLIDKQKQTDAHSQAYTPIYTQYLFSQRLPAVNNKHADCLAAIKRPLRPFSLSLSAAAVRLRPLGSQPAPLCAVLKVWVLLAHIVCYSGGVIQGKQISEHLNKSTPRTEASSSRFDS